MNFFNKVGDGIMADITSVSRDEGVAGAPVDDLSYLRSPDFDEVYAGKRAKLRQAFTEDELDKIDRVNASILGGYDTIKTIAEFSPESLYLWAKYQELESDASRAASSLAKTNTKNPASYYEDMIKSLFRAGKTIEEACSIIAACRDERLITEHPVEPYHRTRLTVRKLQNHMDDFIRSKLVADGDVRPFRLRAYKQRLLNYTKALAAFDIDNHLHSIEEARASLEQQEAVTLEDLQGYADALLIAVCKVKAAIQPTDSQKRSPTGLDGEKDRFNDALLTEGLNSLAVHKLLHHIFAKYYTKEAISLSLQESGTPIAEADAIAEDRCYDTRSDEISKLHIFSPGSWKGDADGRTRVTAETTREGAQDERLLKLIEARKLLDKGIGIDDNVIEYQGVRSVIISKISRLEEKFAEEYSSDGEDEIHELVEDPTIARQKALLASIDALIERLTDYETKVQEDPHNREIIAGTLFEAVDAIRAEHGEALGENIPAKKALGRFDFWVTNNYARRIFTRQNASVHLLNMSAILEVLRERFPHNPLLGLIEEGKCYADLTPAEQMNFQNNFQDPNSPDGRELFHAVIELKMNLEASLEAVRDEFAGNTIISEIDGKPYTELTVDEKSRFISRILDPKDQEGRALKEALIAQNNSYFKYQDFYDVVINRLWNLVDSPYVNELKDVAAFSLKKSVEDLSKEEFTTYMTSKRLNMVAVEMDRNDEIARGMFRRKVRGQEEKWANIYESMIADNDHAADTMHKLFFLHLSGGEQHIYTLKEDFMVFFKEFDEMSRSPEDQGIYRPLLESSVFMQHLQEMGNILMDMDALSDTTKRYGRLVAVAMEVAAEMRHTLCHELGIKDYGKIGSGRDTSRKDLLFDSITRFIHTVQATHHHSFGARQAEFMDETGRNILHGVMASLEMDARRIEGEAETRISDQVRKDATEISYIASMAFNNTRSLDKEDGFGRRREAFINAVPNKKMMDGVGNAARKQRSESEAGDSLSRHRHVKHAAAYVRREHAKAYSPEDEVTITFHQEDVRAIRDDAISKWTGLHMNAVDAHIHTALSSFMGDDIAIEDESDAHRAERLTRIRNAALTHAGLLEGLLIAAYKHSQFMPDIVWQHLPADLQPSQEPTERAEQLEAWAAACNDTPNPEGPMTWQHVREFIAKIQMEEAKNRKAVFDAVCACFSDKAAEAFPGENLKHKVPTAEEMRFFLPRNAQKQIEVQLQRQEGLLTINAWLRRTELEGFDPRQLLGEKCVDLHAVEQGGMDPLTLFKSRLATAITNSFDHNAQMEDPRLGCESERYAEIERLPDYVYQSVQETAAGRIAA